MSRRIWLPLGAVVLVVNAVQWVTAEAITAAAWTHPPYSYATNYISDLGVPDCGAQFQGRDLCSPMHPLMNTSFALEGILFATAVVLLARLTAGRTRRVITALALAHGVGMVMVGLFHGSAEGPDYSLALHMTGAGIGILCANTIAIVAGSLRSLRLPRAYRVFSIAVGGLGLLSEVFVGASENTAGVFERGGVYSWLLWSVVTGTLLLARHLRRPAMVENVPA
ncbi:DUF998 domain-containing protein [Streptomyces sp. SID14478]|uniref:DUF998 domain-containing protein n=1 Tax=Streptomyces sp. SID14478 TaxID=2706073 RepID=UPI0013DA3109|nr:DUF998 domain-containing protein [Streptomyces sp. SID14478]NEB79110.1 DUF998 domain-containing protein [Streptomyces sp. SID14478]